MERKQHSRRSATRITGGLVISVAVVLTSIGIVLAATSGSSADEESKATLIGSEGPDGRPLPIPTPDPGTAKPIDEARRELLLVDGVGELIEAVESRDVTTILGLMEAGTDSCSSRRDPVADCAALNGEKGGSFETVTVEDAIVFQLAKNRAQVLLERALGGDGIPHISLVTRDVRSGETSNRYYIAFATPRLEVDESLARIISLNGPIDGLAFQVDPAAATPVLSVSVLLPTWSALEWAQIHGAQFQELVTPVSIGSFTSLDD